MFINQQCLYEHQIRLMVKECASADCTRTDLTLFSQKHPKSSCNSGSGSAQPTCASLPRRPLHQTPFCSGTTGDLSDGMLIRLLFFPSHRSSLGLVVDLVSPYCPWSITSPLRQSLSHEPIKPNHLSIPPDRNNENTGQ
jgi:hypothetical protein